MFKLVLLSTLVALAASTGLTPRLDGRIVGGEAVTIEEYPYQLSLLYRGSHICGASLISDKFAVTAAHCTDGSSASDMSIRAGSSIRNSGGVVVNVKRIMQNPDFNPYFIDFDMTVLELETPLQFGPGVQTIALPGEFEDVPAGSVAVCSGWGTTSEGGSPANQLQAVRVNTISYEACKRAYGEDNVTDRMICASVSGGGKDACQGDSGGPLVVDGKLVGIVSWGYGCARPEYPGVYGSVPEMRRFITDSAGI